MSRVTGCYQSRGIVKRCNDEERHNKVLNQTGFFRFFFSISLVTAFRVCGVHLFIAASWLAWSLYLINKYHDSTYFMKMHQNGEKRDIILT